MSRTWARARRSAGKCSGDAVEMAETKRDGRTNPDAQARRGNETGCVDKSCGRLFDIVKRERVRSVPRATFAFARGRSHISGSCALRHRRPSASDGQAAGGLERNRFGRNHRFAPGIFWSHGLIESLQIFEIMLRPGRRRWPTRRAMKKDGRRVTRRRDRGASNRQPPGHARAYGTRRATL